ncbi:glycine--tRNA ligase [Egibacter rhizosphaerae]|uniref:Glycine--tRNA ligase n=2 Tax=Egibacter rhizosphaerae TaxID=1670831 RepID=A0A411YL09_9ACTN|nr:glycine--tRNA ligase [Egibacter rhizosphaerae]
MREITELCKRRGIIFQSSEIYGGLRGAWDFGPLGAALKDNVKAAWKRHMIQLRGDVVQLDASVLMHPRVWEASGHIENFTDPLTECRTCNARFRADQVTQGDASTYECPRSDYSLCEFGEPRQFNLLFQTHVGPTQESGSEVWLRPETAQAMFVDFAHVQLTSRQKVPFGIAQVGKSFRNEITPRNFIFRVREFEQMEMEYFVRPGTDEAWHEYWIKHRWDWYTRYGLRAENLRIRPHASDELSHYAKRTVDVEYRFPFAWSELEGIANRTDFDLGAHAETSGKDLTYYDGERDERYLPYVIEPAAGVDRAALAFLIDAYRDEQAPAAKGGTERRVWLQLHHALAPVKVAVLPLSRNEKLVPTAREVADLLRPRFPIEYDDAASIGKRYRRQDEIGTPFCVTVDFETVEDDRAVTVRDRDTMTQERVAIDQLSTYLDERLDLTP